jgi:hypothetical protein
MSGAPGDFTLGGVSTQGLGRVVTRFERAARSLHDALLGIITEEVELIADNARQRMAELFKNPAKMQASIATSVEDGGSFIYGAITASGLPYLRIHEFGGMVQTPDIFPVNARVLHFFTPGAAFFRPEAKSATSEVFAKSTRAHPTVLPERSYLRYALQQRRSALRARFAQAVADSLGGG